MPKRKERKDFFAVAVGRKDGIFSTYDECEEQVKGYPGNRFRGFYFGEEEEAQKYLNSYAVSFAPLPYLEPNKIERPTM